MPLSQQKFREIVFQILYSQDIGQADPELMLELMMNELAVTKRNVKAAQERVDNLLEKREEIDRLIGSVSSSYDFDRIQTVTKNILRLGVFELLFDDSIPPKVAIAESIRLARKFGAPESASFVNALLDHLYKGKQGQPADLKNIEEQAKVLDESEEASKKLAEEAKKMKNLRNDDEPV